MVAGRPIRVYFEVAHQDRVRPEADRAGSPQKCPVSGRLRQYALSLNRAAPRISRGTDLYASGRRTDSFM